MGKRLAAGSLAVSVLLVASFAGAPGAGASAPLGWRNLDKRVRPPAASAAAMVYDEARAEMVMFGGVGETAEPTGTWLNGGTGWRPAPAGVEPPNPYGAAMAYDVARELTILFGGYVWDEAAERYRPSAETWAWDGTSWAKLDLLAAPSPRAFSSMAYDRANGEIVLFGGMAWDSGQPEEAGDTWIFDGTRWRSVETPSAPGPRNGAGITFHDALGRIVLFGGAGQGTGVPCTITLVACFELDPTARSDDGMKADTWMWDGTTWTQIATPHAPPTRTSMGMSYDLSSEDIVVFGGVNLQGAFEDTWTFDGADWTEVTPPDSPERRFSPVMATDRSRGEVLLFGGHRASYLADDSWMWRDGAWYSADVPTPKPRFGPSLVFDSADDQIVMFGGDADHVFSDTWVYRDSWERLSPAVSPPGRAQAGEAFDAARGETVVFAGQAYSGDDLGDTWTFDGTQWIERTPSLPGLSPYARREPAMTFDSARGEVVLFGGWNTDLGYVFSDTWTWDGSTWTPKLGLTSPMPISDASMAFDDARDQVVMFGGLDSSNRLMSETWLWDGVAWTQAQPATVPPARSGASMAYVPELEAVVMFGGLGADEGVWVWDGDDWTHLEFPTGPLRRSWAGFAYGSEVGGAFLFGGARSGYLSDTWVFGPNS